MKSKNQPYPIDYKKNSKVFFGGALSYYQQGLDYYNQSLFDSAKDAWQKAISIDPAFMDARASLGLCYMRLKQFQMAKNILKQGLKNNSNHIPSLINLALAYYEEDNFAKASELYEKVLKIDSKNSNALFGYGKLLYQIGSYRQSIKYLKQVILINHSFCEALYLLGCAYQDSHKNQEAIECFNKIININPDYRFAYYNLGKIYQSTGELSVAESYYKKAIQIKSDFSEVYASLGGLYLDMADIHNANKMYIKAMQNNNDINILSVYLYFLNFKPQNDRSQTFYYNRKWSNNILSQRKIFSHNNHDYSTERKINIGYVSSDFRVHSVYYFISPVLFNHDPYKFNIFIYSNVQKKDLLTEKIQALNHTFRDIRGMGALSAAECIKYDKIDFLVDLSGHTYNNRLDIFALKPSPLQVTYLGYPNTTGLHQIDYRFTDSITDPIGDNIEYTEKIWQLDPPFVCYNPPESLPEISLLPFSYNDYITFGSFNYLGKINYKVIKLWSELLKKIPKSRLFLKSRPLHDLKVKKRISDLFSQEGIDKKRLLLKGHVGSYFDHLSQYNLVDIALDPFPYNGTTTTCESLLMGVPVLTVEGINHAARVGKSLLYSIGLKDWVARNEKELLIKTQVLMSNKRLLINLRSKLRNLFFHTDLCNQKKHTQKLEAAFYKIWQKKCSDITKK